MDAQAASVAAQAVALRGSHPHAPALDVLDLVMEGLPPSSRVRVDFGEALHPCQPFGQLIAAAFDECSPPGDWYLIERASTPAAVASALLRIWSEEVLPKFRERYALVGPERA